MKSVQIRCFFWSAFSGIRTEYGEILRISPYSVRMWENTDQKKLRIWTLFTQTLKLTMLLGLASAATSSEIDFLDIRYLIKHSSGYTFHFGKSTKHPRFIKFYIFKENQSLYVCQCIDLYLERTKQMRGQNSQLLLSFVKPHGPVSTPTISR